MTQKFRLYRRGCNGRFYTHDNTTGKQESLATSDKAEVLRLLMAKNEADVQPAFNAQIARTYLAADDPAMGQRTWQEVIDAFKNAKAQQRESTQDRYDQASREPIMARFASRRLLDGEPGRTLSQQRQKVLLVFFHHKHSRAPLAKANRGEATCCISRLLKIRLSCLALLSHFTQCIE